MGAQTRSLREPPVGGRRRRAVNRVADTAATGHLASVQRARMLSAMIDVSCELGAGSVTVTDVVKRSGVSRRTFYEMFSDREDCFAASFEQALESATARVNESHDRDAAWREQIRTGLVAFLSFLDEEPRLGRILLVESISGSPGVAARRRETIASLTKLLDERTDGARGAAELPALTSEGLVGAVLSVLQNRLLDPAHGPLLTLANELASMIFLPYLGAAAARRELKRQPPTIEKAPGVSFPRPVDPFKEAHMRLTYRTVRVLTATAAHPGASNRLIGDAAEVKDQGQISKLLNRLKSSGLIENTGTDVGQGGANAWTLTQAGEQFLSSIGTHPQQVHESVTSNGTSKAPLSEEGM